MSKGYVYILTNSSIRKGVAAMALALATLLCARGETETIGDYTWTYQIQDGTAKIYKGSSRCAVSPEPTGDLTIPSTLGEYPVTSIGDSAFYYCYGLTNVTIPLGVTSIGGAAFYYCSGLASVTIPESVTSIGQEAFLGCSGLTSVTIPSSVTGIGSGAFLGCNGVCNATVPGWKCWIDFSSVTNLVISERTTNIGESAFLNCSGLTSVTIPSSVTNIGRQAFIDCSGLTSVTMPEGVTSIGASAFYGCSGLTSVTIPSSVTSIGGSAFHCCSGLISFFVDEDNPNYKSVNGLLLTKDGITLVAGVNGDVVIPSCVTSIGGHAFSGCSGLASVTIPSSVTSIGNYSFSGCTGLASVTIPSSVTSIGYNAFHDCSGLTSVTISAGVTDIPEGAFEGCGGLTSLTIPSSVTSIGRYAFTGCYMLTNVTLEGDAPAVGDNVFNMIPSGLVVHVKKGSSGWTQWNGRELRFDADGGTASSTVNMNLTVTNVHVHYIRTSELSPMAAPVTKDVGIVNVMTEIKGGNVSIPESWVTNYPTFKATFGDDFTSALVKTTGKVGAGGSPLFVWQDYVAGTDPTDENDVFRASVTMVEGKPVISYTPELSEIEKAKRKYVTWGKVKLQDEKWVEVPKGNEDEYNFFKVTVEMK